MSCDGSQVQSSFECALDKASVSLNTRATQTQTMQISLAPVPYELILHRYDVDTLN